MKWPRHVISYRFRMPARSGLPWMRSLAAHRDELARVAAGETKLIGFLVGQVMRASGGKADPEKVGALIRDRADA